MATAGYTTTDKFKARITSLLGGNAVVDEDLAEDCLTDAYRRILAILLKRGVTKANAGLWIEGASYQLRLASYYYFTNKATRRNTEKGDGWLTALDITGEIASKDFKLTKSDGSAIATDEAAVEVWDLEDD